MKIIEFLIEIYSFKLALDVIGFKKFVGKYNYFKWVTQLFYLSF